MKAFIVLSRGSFNTQDLGESGESIIGIYLKEESAKKIVTEKTNEWEALSDNERYWDHMDYWYDEKDIIED